MKKKNQYPRAAARIVEEDIYYAGAPPQYNQDPPQEQVPLGGQVPVIAPVMCVVEIREAFLNVTQVMATQDQGVTTQDKVMTAQANWGVAPSVNQNASTMDSHFEGLHKDKPSYFIWKAFLDRFFQREKREAKVEEFINLRQQEERRSEMLHDNMELSRFMVHVQQVEESRHNRKNMDVKSARPYDGDVDKDWQESCKEMFDGYEYLFWLSREWSHCERFYQDQDSKKRKKSRTNKRSSFGAREKKHFYFLKSRGDQEGSPILLTNLSRTGNRFLHRFDTKYSIHIYSSLWDGSELEELKGLGCVLMQHGKVIAFASIQLKDYDMTVLYHPRKTNVVTDALIQISIGSVAHVKDGKKDLVKDVRRLAQLGVRIEDSPRGGFMVHHSFE
ncbi:hypothetical protein EJD97_010090 [Solanum chilense]|uniref:Uncharacterized protein n=1 Tax=Solanum chilense TaxID=4083 RepID=A0A6N2CKK2_SOLCI|nr:hypothetical protein EJD97_010090 [Solanum chilense]